VSCLHDESRLGWISVLLGLNLWLQETSGNQEENESGADSVIDRQDCARISSEPDSVLRESYRAKFISLAAFLKSKRVGCWYLAGVLSLEPR